MLSNEHLQQHQHKVCAQRNISQIRVAGSLSCTSSYAVRRAPAAAPSQDLCSEKQRVPVPEQLQLSHSAEWLAAYHAPARMVLSLQVLEYYLLGPSSRQGVPACSDFHDGFEVLTPLYQWARQQEDKSRPMI